MFKPFNPLALFMETRYFHLSTITYIPNPFISVLHNFALSQQKSEYLRLTLENFLKKALLLVWKKESHV